MRFKKRTFSPYLFLACVLLFILFSPLWPGISLTSAAVTAPNTTNATADATWMMQAVISGGTMDGAIASYTDQQHIRPYQANLGALGLARTTHITGDTSYVTAVWNYLHWYVNHMDGSNYVHDWDLISGVWTEAPNSVLTNPYDSTDSFAATFLLATRAAYNADPDMTKLNSLHTGIVNAVAAIHSTQQSDGLTWATPTFHGKLAEDNAETYQGLRAGQDLLQLLGDTTEYNNTKSYADLMPAGLETMWIPGSSVYGVQKSDVGVVVAPTLTTLSPDAMVQGWMVAYKIPSVSRGQGLLTLFETNQPNWDKPSLNGTNYDVAPIGWGYYYTGDTTRAQLSATNLRSAAILNSRAYPYTIMSAGEIIITETEGEDFIFSLLTTPTPTPSPTPTVTTTAGSPPRQPNAGPPSCTSAQPIGAPYIFFSQRNKTTATLYVAPPPLPYSSFYVRYDTVPGGMRYGVEFPQKPLTGVLAYEIRALDPHQTYYFTIRAGNTCKTGTWSNEIKSPWNKTRM